MKSIANRRVAITRLDDGKLAFQEGRTTPLDGTRGAIIWRAVLTMFVIYTSSSQLMTATVQHAPAAPTTASACSRQAPPDEHHGGLRPGSDDR